MINPVVLSHAHPPLENDFFGLNMVMQEINRRQEAHTQKNSTTTQEKQSATSVKLPEAEARLPEAEARLPEAEARLPEVEVKLSEVEVIEPHSMTAVSPAIADTSLVDSMRSPPSHNLVGVLNQSLQAVSRLSTSVVLKGADIAAPFVVSSLRGSAEAIAAHYPEQLQKLAMLAEEGQKKLQVLTNYVGEMGDRYTAKSKCIDQQWDGVNHSAQELQKNVRQAAASLSDVKQEAYRSALRTGAVIGSMYALSCVASYCGWGSALQKGVPSLGWMAAGMAGKAIYDCYHSESFQQLSEACTEIFTGLTQMGQGGCELSNELMTSASSVLHDAGVLMSEARSAGFIPHESLL